MELLEGATLAQHLRSKGPFSVAAARPLVDQMLDAPEAAHQRGIIHRDFKSANVMLTERATKAVVMDFGLARSVVSCLPIGFSKGAHASARAPLGWPGPKETADAPD
jgi:serine/threonine protein kinase